MFINFEGNMMFNRFNGTLCKLFSVVAVGMALSQPSFAEKPAMDVSRVYVAGSNAKVSMAHSVLLRTDKRLAFRVQTRDLEPGAYTLWLVYFNDPEKCIGGDGVGAGKCGNKDLNPALSEARGDFVIVDGRVVGKKGHGVFTGHYKLGSGVGMFNGFALDNTRKAEYQLVVRSHGPVIDELLHEQLTSMNGGCPPNTCANVQYAVHP